MSHENHDRQSRQEDHHAFVHIGFAEVRQDPPNLNETIEGRQSGIPSTDVDPAEAESSDAYVDGDEGVEDYQTVEEVAFVMYPKFGTDFYLASSGAFGPAPACIAPEVARELPSSEDTMSDSMIVHAPESEPQSMQSSMFVGPLAGLPNVDGGHIDSWILLEHPTENTDLEALMGEVVEAASGRAYSCHCQCRCPRYR